jgi:CheY-like chemotaxis protein
MKINTTAAKQPPNVPKKANHVPRILLVDDEQDTIDIFTEALVNRGLEVDGFTNPVGALDHFVANPGRYAMIVSDIKMPQMNGFELVRAVRAMAPEVQVLLITAFEIDMAEFTQVLPSTKIDGFIKKPITPAKLVERVREHLGIAERRRNDSGFRETRTHEVS